LTYSAVEGEMFPEISSHMTAPAPLEGGADQVSSRHVRHMRRAISLLNS